MYKSAYAQIDGNNWYTHVYEVVLDNDPKPELALCGDPLAKTVDLLDISTFPALTSCSRCLAKQAKAYSEAAVAS